MNASAASQLLLLELQGLDLRESRLRHTRDSHPAHATVRELAGRAEDLNRAAISQSAVIADIEREIARCEAEIEKVRARRERQQGRIDRNEVPLRDINPMQHEIAQMDTRLTTLENAQLASEEKAEAARDAQAAMKEEAEAIRTDVNKAKAEFAADIEATDNELREVLAARRDLVERIGSDLIAEYDRSRKRNGALAVIEVRDGVPQGIATELSPAELEDIRRTPEDELYWAESTGQIVVRTSSE
ncbi:MAG: hypothetical protein Q4C87_09110 [Actinomycetaceae bacterium]|nr:hypothetical protein [Actinomycetaceae bacterium]